MKAIFNKNEIYLLLQNFYNCTHLPISFFDADYNCISYSTKDTNFCTYLFKFADMKNACTCSTAQRFEESKKQGDTIIYRCHAGLIDTITPIFYQNTLIAYIMIGQFRDKEKIYSTKTIMETCLSKYNVDLDKFKNLYNQLPCISSKELYSLLSILKLCIKFLWSEQLIQCKSNMLASEINAYIDSHIADDLTINILCKTFFISRQSLYSLFKNEFNDSIKNFINTKRFVQAKKLLKETSLPISEVAALVGFSNYNYFIRLFKSKFKITPLQYRFKTIAAKKS